VRVRGGGGGGRGGRGRRVDGGQGKNGLSDDRYRLANDAVALCKRPTLDSGRTDTIFGL